MAVDKWITMWTMWINAKGSQYNVDNLPIV